MYVPSFPGQGAIYSVIVQQTGVISNTQKAAYVSSTSYSCTFDVNGSGQYCYDLGIYIQTFLRLLLLVASFIVTSECVLIINDYTILNVSFDQTRIILIFKILFNR